MPVYKDETKGTWYASFYYKDWQGKRLKKMRRGFATKREAQSWEREFLQEKAADLSMKFGIFLKIYEKDIKNRIKENTWRSKENIIRTKIAPYFGELKMNEIQPKDVVQWQNGLLEYRNERGAPYSKVYLKTVHNQLTSVFNHAIRYYNLRENPARKAGNMGKDTGRETEFWTKEDYKMFRNNLTEESSYYYGFEMLYWAGLRVGELMALTEEDFNFQEKTVEISKSFQRIQGKDVITPPKTLKSNRVVTMPDFLVEEIKEYLDLREERGETGRLFCYSKSSMRYEMKRICKQIGQNPIKIHSVRHSHVSLLIEMGLSPVAIADRVGHESIDITFRYAHLFPSKQREIADQLNQVAMEP